MVAVTVALVPVTAFLLLLILFDSFKLVPRRTVIRAVASGSAAALVALALHAWLYNASGLDTRTFARYVAPCTEEVLKGACLLYFLQRGQLGFLVDAAIIGFGIGAGFALVENVTYLRELSEPRIWVWLARGFGTAIMHASATAIVAVTAKALLDRYQGRALLAVLPGLAIAAGLHATFNRALVSPVLAAAVLLLVVPLVVLAVFDRSERWTREWIGGGLDLDVELLALIQSSHFGETRLGRYLAALQSRFPGPIVADMFCLLQLELELSIRAKGLLMAREAGLEVPADEQLRASLAERAYLHRAIGPTGLLALRPLQVTSHRDDWHRYLLDHARTSRDRSRDAR
ncbi:MAG: PrsW family glutamic-type intramembrane protease [Vicinamibacterales bacterium]